jgi:hypothetical protein
MKRLACLPLLALAACGQPEPILILPPAELATCADEPEPPVLPARDGTDATQLERDKRMLDGYLTLRSAYGDCKAKVEGLARWREEAQD